MHSQNCTDLCWVSSLKILRSRLSQWTAIQEMVYESIFISSLDRNIVQCTSVPPYYIWVYLHVIFCIYSESAHGRYLTPQSMLSRQVSKYCLCLLSILCSLVKGFRFWRKPQIGQAWYAVLITRYFNVSALGGIDSLCVVPFLQECLHSSRLYADTQVGQIFQSSLFMHVASLQVQTHYSMQG